MISGYIEGIIILICVNSIAAMGVSLLTGFTGIFTLGHAGYMAIGAYTAVSFPSGTTSPGSWLS